MPSISIVARRRPTMPYGARGMVTSRRESRGEEFYGWVLSAPKQKAPPVAGPTGGAIDESFAGDYLFFLPFFGFLAAPRAIFAREMSPSLSTKYRYPGSFFTPTFATF